VRGLPFSQPIKRLGDRDVASPSRSTAAREILTLPRTEVSHLYNSVIGLRVSLGRIPSYNPIRPDAACPIGAQLMAVQGPLVRSMRDARLALTVMSQGDPRDTRWVDVPLAGPLVPRPIRVALVAHNPGGFTHPAQAEAVRQAGRHLVAAGYAVEEVMPPDLDEIIAIWHRISSTDVPADHSSIKAIGNVGPTSRVSAALDSPPTVRS
jgi:amidase